MQASYKIKIFPLHLDRSNDLSIIDQTFHGYNILNDIIITWFIHRAKKTYTRLIRAKLHVADESMACIVCIAFSRHRHFIIMYRKLQLGLVCQF